jgi:methionine-rich copper-binding protein CopC
MHETRGRFARPPLLLVAAAFALVGLGAPASAHSALVSSTPTEGGSVEAPTHVSLVFNEALLEAGTEVSVTDASGATTVLTPTYPEPTTLVASLPALAPGGASVAWRVVSADGHPIEGVLSFTVTAPSAPPADDSPSADAATTAQPSASPSPSASIMPISAPANSGGLPAWLWAALVIAVLAAAGVAVATSRRR